MKRAKSPDVRRCSFCHKTEDTVGKLVSSPGDYSPAHICDECIAVCASILGHPDIPSRSQNSTIVAPPDASEYAPYYGRYISLVAADELLAAMREQAQETRELFAGFSGAEEDYRYAPDKWSVKEMMGHVIDAERIFAYRALRIARNDRTPLAGFEQDDYVRYGGFAELRLADLIEEFTCVRRGNVLMFRQFSPEAWMRRGIADQKEISVRAIAYIIAGHELNHQRVLAEKYRGAEGPGRLSVAEQRIPRAVSPPA